MKSANPVIRLDEEEVESRVAKLRKELSTQGPIGQDVKSYVPISDEHSNISYCICRLKPHQIHDLAVAKEKEMEKIRQALGIREDYVEGDAFKRMRERDRAAE